MDLRKKLFSIDKSGYHRVIRIFGIKFSYLSKYLLNQKLARMNYNIQSLHKLLDFAANPSDLPPAKGELRQGQLLSIRLLNDIKGICDGNNLTYWLDFGTLLGAVRHGGYIPWDSDIDISMLREDFYKIIPLLKEKYTNSEIEVREFGYNNHFQVRIQSKDNDTYGVDIFPIDKYYKSDLTEEEIKNISEEISQAALIMKNKCTHIRKYRYNAELSRKEIKKITNKYILKNNKPLEDKPALFYAIDYPVPDTIKIKNYDVIFPLKTIKFEGGEYSCPNKTEEFLASLFSKNYMHFPKSFSSDGDKVAEYTASTESEAS